MKTMYIYGKQPVIEVLTERPDLVIRAYIMGSVKLAGYEDIRHLCVQKRIPVNALPDKKFEQLVGDVSHQGVMLELKEFPYTDLEDWLGSLDMDTLPSAILLDEIQDVHNVGAIIRTAAATGMSAVLIPSHRQAPITSTVFKTSAGTVMRIPIIKIGNINQTLERLHELRFWSYGLTAGGTTSLFDYVHDTASIFIIGNESEGIREKTQALCDATIAIPMQAGVESLNASVSAALCMYEVMRKKG